VLAVWLDKLSDLGHDQLSQLAVYATAALFTVIIALLGLQLYQTVAFMPSVQTGKAKPAAINKAYKVSDIVRNNLFGMADSKQKPGAYDNLPETQARLILRGSFTASNPALASAIIEGADNESRSYKINSRIQGNVRLKAVYRDRVVLARGNRLETLYFPEPSSDFSDSELDTIDTADIGSAANSTVISKPVKQLTNDQKNQLIRQRLQELRERARSSRTKK
jgi:general secretion pathway protein C